MDKNLEEEITIICDGNNIEFDSTNRVNYNELKLPFYLRRLNKQSLLDDQVESFKNKNVLLIGIYNFSRISNVLTLHSLGFKRLISLHTRVHWAAKYFHDIIIAEDEDLSKKEDTLEKVKEYMVKNDFTFDAILTYYEDSILMTAYLCEKFNLKSVPFDYALKMRNKYKFRIECMELGIPYTKCFRIKPNERMYYVHKMKECAEQIKFVDDLQSDKEAQCDKIVRDLFGLQLPCIVKNVYGSGKTYVRKCDTFMDLVNSIESSITEIIEYAACSAELVIEEFYEGHEIDFDIIVKDNKAIFLSISDNFPQYPPYFLETGSIIPSVYLNTEEMEYIENEITKWISKFKFGNAILCGDAKCRPMSLYRNWAYLEDNTINAKTFLMPIEFNIRTGGDDDVTNMRTAHGVDFYREYFNILFDIPIDKTKLLNGMRHPPNKCVSTYFYGKKGKIKKMEIDFKRIIETPEIYEANILKRVGDEITPNSLIGWIAIKASMDTPIKELGRKLKEYSSYLKYEVD